MSTQIIDNKSDKNPKMQMLLLLLGPAVMLLTCLIDPPTG
ncbi:hypothetical protein LCGC14_1473620, partial [marine sediment metagenome]